ncbi:hypothetical protein PFFCH_05083 [Plasmodium falciparum FCH/4]|uniref:Pre-mRNA-splicing factor 18 n=1 Tax=Plasmodium falciparum FCH/4 TaxID=1036724 RepID=A0A024VHW5_PLAFA|nr:hypothetical protein PFFCH_05083 [Plasmodium falciparum FCH/4]
MVGIHERAGRSKIYASEVAHILNDETTRKYIQMIKRWFKQADLENQKNKEINNFYEKELKKKKIEEYERLKKLNDTLDEKHKKNNADVENEETNIG